ncbi:hypothetical protein [Trichloromonas sp.]|uniref:hypothetical protein n=1 Tax=Trichloromonas sp. TaxID=3069249 RepID=UPI002A47B2DA|nr:hypothetical protein [Trichloromonas sp.]
MERHRPAGCLPPFDDLRDRSAVNLLWRLAARIDSRIEPIPCGSRQWREDDSSAIIEIARREGHILDAAWCLKPLCRGHILLRHTIGGRFRQEGGTPSKQ